MTYKKKSNHAFASLGLTQCVLLDIKAIYTNDSG